MPIRIAMPIAHVTGGPNYTSYYAAGNCVIRVVNYFNVNNCAGISIQRDPAAPAALSDSIWDLYAFTDGYLSFQNNSLVLRLPRELDYSASVQMYNSGRLFMELKPAGAQLRHVVYSFNTSPGNDVSDKITNILQTAGHPALTLSRDLDPNSIESVTLGDYIAADPSNLVKVVSRFMAGSSEIFVRASDVIGNFRNLNVELRFIDSCGNPTTNPAPPGGRSLNPAYFLYLVSSTTNAANVTMLTSLIAVAPNPPDTTHPLLFLLDPARVVAAGQDSSLGWTLAATRPPPPLHVTVQVQNSAGVTIAASGIPMRGLGEWHQSRNAANPFNTGAPVKWRLYGNQSADTNVTDYGRFITQVFPGMSNQLPGPVAFDHQFTPQNIHNNRVPTYWDRYRYIFNQVANAFQFPVEILIATACTETSIDLPNFHWYDPIFANSREMDVIRMEPVFRKIAAGVPVPTPAQVAAQITANVGDQALLVNYMNLAGLRIQQGNNPQQIAVVGPKGANALLPVPWSGGTPVQAGNPLTWNQLRDLIQSYKDNVKVSPGVMQTLVETARDDLNNWGASFYGAGFVHLINILHNAVPLVADNPPANRGTMFSDWFGVSVDATGTNTTNSANVDVELTKMKRAMHSIIAGAAHLKKMYNTVGGTAAHPSNIITDFDLPTSFSGFNDGAGVATPLGTNPTDNDKWHKLFKLIYYDENYPRMAPRFYNAAVNYFNTTPGLNPLPAVRIWRG